MPRPKKRSSYADHAESVSVKLSRMDEQYRNILSEWTEKECPFKKGEKIEIPAWELHAGHLMKIITRSCCNMSEERHRFKWVWSLEGITLRVDGSPGVAARRVGIVVPMGEEHKVERLTDEMIRERNKKRDGERRVHFEKIRNIGQKTKQPKTRRS